MRRIFAVAGLVLALASPAMAQLAISCPANARSMTRLELLFGLSIPSGGQVSAREWEEFLAKEVTPRFPEGLTIIDAYGQWRNPTGVITREASKLLLVWYVPDVDSDARVEAIRDAYKARFRQDSVLRVDAAFCVSF